MIETHVSTLCLAMLCSAGVAFIIAWIMFDNAPTEEGKIILIDTDIIPLPVLEQWAKTTNNDTFIVPYSGYKMRQNETNPRDAIIVSYQNL